MASSSSNNKLMAAEKAVLNPDPHPLKCPRCDSSNTKFCYYNNYSLSQPRHFCKACKRYWTRGGTLRNVPVGGGCRKNKRSKRHSSIASGGEGIPSSAVANTNQIDLPSSASNHIQNPLLYGLPTNPLDLSFPFSSFRVSSDTSSFNLHPQIDGLGLGFGSDSGYKNGFKSMQDVISNSSSPPFSASANNSIFSAYSSSFSTSSTMASLLASTLQQQQQKFASKDIGSPYTIPGLMPYEDPQVKGEGENRFSWNPNPNPNPNPNSNPIDQINSSDPSSLLWNNTSMSAWFDPSTMGSSSVPSLI